MSKKARSYTNATRYEETPAQVKNREARNRARAELEKQGGKKLPKTQEVDHIKPLSKGGSNRSGNLRVVSRHTNRTKGAK